MDLTQIAVATMTPTPVAATAWWVALPQPVSIALTAMFGLTQGLILALMGRWFLVRDRIEKEKREALEAERAQRVAWQNKIEDQHTAFAAKQVDQDKALLRVERGIEEIRDFIEPIREATRSNLRKRFEEHDEVPAD